MHSKDIVLLSNKGKIATAIIDILSEQFNVQQFAFADELLLQHIRFESDRFQNTDVIILNLSETPGDSELLFSALQAACKNVPVIVLHLYHQKTFADAFLKMGAKAYLSINFHTEDLLAAIEQVIAKKTFIGRNIS